MKAKNFLISTAQGAAIGVAMIIPGVSGGTIAVLMNVYDKLIDAISNLRRDFKNSFFTLLPILLGALVAVAACIYPIRLALEYAPFPTVMLFAGLMVGSCPKLIRDGISKGFKPINIASLIIPLALVVGICFIPNIGNADLSSSMPWYGYILLILIGAVASCALVVPGVSGSMLLLIFGYYNALFTDTLSALTTNFGHSALVFLLFAVGVVIGFFSIAKLMKLSLNKFPRGTFWAIIGFVLGSVPAIFITYNSNFPDFVYFSLSTAHIVVGVVLCVLGIIGSFSLTSFVEAKNKKALSSEQEK